MEENKEKENNTAAMPDDDLDQVSGGASGTYTGEFTLSIEEDQKMNDLWDMMYAYGSYGKAVKEVVDAFCKCISLQTLNNGRYRASKKIVVVAKDEVVTVNGTRVYLP